MAEKISIIGAAGTLGSCAAYAIATNGLADELVLLDINENLTKCHVMDLETAVTGIQNVRIKAGTYEDLVGSHVIINAAGAPWRFITSRMELLNDSMPITRKIAENVVKFCPDAVIITATNPVDPLNYAIYRITGMDRKRLLGYSLNDSFRFRMMAARLLKVDSTRVDGLVVGEHGPHQVMLFSSLRVDGKQRKIDPADKQQIREEIPKALHAYESLRTSRTTGWTSAVGLSAIASAIINDTGEVFPCSVVLDGEYGYQGMSASLPVGLGKDGWRDPLPLEMEPEEETAFSESMDYLRDTARGIEEILAGQ